MRGVDVHRAFQVKTKYGKITWYEYSQTIVASCSAHHNCSLCRTIKPPLKIGRITQGRPLGLCVAWLFHCPCGITAREHVHGFKPTFQQRLECRRAFLALDVDMAAQWADKEDPAGGLVDEPEDIV